MQRIVSRFSCGAASAVATKLVLAEFGDTRDVHIINAFIKQEHEDNARFMADCERWYGRPITRLRDQRYGASTIQVFRERKYMAGLSGAACTKFLKREVLDAYGRPDDVMVLGYTVEEQHRLDQFIDANNDKRVLAPLIDRGLTKGDCKAMLTRAGIPLPVMYLMGYKNNNCKVCVKAGEGTMNKARIDFPAEFEELAAAQDLIGPSAYLYRDRKTGKRYSLRDLPPGKGRHADEPEVQCGVHCELAEQQIRGDVEREIEDGAYVDDAAAPAAT